MNTPHKKECGHTDEMHLEVGCGHKKECEKCGHYNYYKSYVCDCPCHTTPPQEKGWPKSMDDVIMDFHFRRDNSEEDNKDTYEFATKLITATEERVREEIIARIDDRFFLADPEKKDWTLKQIRSLINNKRN